VRKQYKSLWQNEAFAFYIDSVLQKKFSGKPLSATDLISNYKCPAPKILPYCFQFHKLYKGFTGDRFGKKSKTKDATLAIPVNIDTDGGYAMILSTRMGTDLRIQEAKVLSQH
jgi:hypothetical protein